VCTRARIATGRSAEAIQQTRKTLVRSVRRPKPHLGLALLRGTGFRHRDTRCRGSRSDLCVLAPTVEVSTVRWAVPDSDGRLVAAAESPPWVSARRKARLLASPSRRCALARVVGCAWLTIVLCQFVLDPPYVHELLKVCFSVFVWSGLQCSCFIRTNLWCTSGKRTNC